MSQVAIRIGQAAERIPQGDYWTGHQSSSQFKWPSSNGLRVTLSGCPFDEVEELFGCDFTSVVHFIWGLKKRLQTMGAQAAGEK